MKNLCALLFAFFLVQFTQAQNIIIPDANFKNALVNSNCADVDGDGIIDGDADTNNDGEIQLSEAKAINYLKVQFDNITSLVGIENFTNLESLRCAQNNISSLEPLSGLTSLRNLDAEYNQISSFDATSLVNLESLNIRLNGLTSLNVDDLLQLTELRCQQNELTNLNVTTVLNLESMYCGNNQISELNLNGLYNLELISTPNNLLTRFDITETSVGYISVNDNDLTELFVKNGIQTAAGNTGTIGGNPNLKYICADESESDFFLNQINTYNYSAIVNSYCSFSPGGETYTIQGTGKQSFDDNVCDVNDQAASNIKYLITNGNESSFFFANINGEYLLDVEEGSNTIMPVLQHPEYYTITPSSKTFNFPTETSPANQDFCFLPSDSVKNDLEIIIIPIFRTAPGFIASYKIIYRNKGNTTILSESIQLEYNENAMSFDSSSYEPISNSNGLITWGTENLQPSVTRSFIVKFLINTPTETNSVQIGDILKFNAEIQPIPLDETPDDNVFSLCVTVVGAVDPNDIICLEGESVLEEKVGDFVHYKIRFENIGTANAVNVVVKDVIDSSKFDISSLIPVDGSHTFETRIRKGNIVEFIFENIQLPFDDANNDGYLVFKIKTLETLQVGDTFENEAEIYFDFNAPIITNNYSTVIADKLSVNEFETFEFSLYPNPVKDYITIASSINVDLVNIIDIKGRLIKTFRPAEQDFENLYNISNLTSGLYFIQLKSGENSRALKFFKK